MDDKKVGKKRKTTCTSPTAALPRARHRPIRRREPPSCVLTSPHATLPDRVSLGRRTTIAPTSRHGDVFLDAPRRTSVAVNNDVRVGVSSDRGRRERGENRRSRVRTRRRRREVLPQERRAGRVGTFAPPRPRVFHRRSLKKVQLFSDEEKPRRIGARGPVLATTDARVARRRRRTWR